MPEWVLNQLREYPVLGVVLAIVCVVVHYMNKQAAAQVAREKEFRAEMVAAATAELRSLATKYEAEIARLERNHGSALRAKDAEIRRLVRQNREERDNRRRRK